MSQKSSAVTIGSLAGAGASVVVVEEPPGIATGDDGAVDVVGVPEDGCDPLDVCDMPVPAVTGDPEDCPAEDSVGVVGVAEGEVSVGELVGDEGSEEAAEPLVEVPEGVDVVDVDEVVDAPVDGDGCAVTGDDDAPSA
jgi:hypothetical protein